MLDVFVRMCKYNSFDTYSIVHNSEVHMQTTTQEDTEVHMKKAIKDENKTQEDDIYNDVVLLDDCLLYTSPSPRDVEECRMPSSA